MNASRRTWRGETAACILIVAVCVALFVAASFHGAEKLRHPRPVTTHPASRPYGAASCGGITSGAGADGDRSRP